MPWPADPTTHNPMAYIPFVQKDWMAEYSEFVGNTPMTSPGVCMALTTQLFEYRKNGKTVRDYFNWVKSQDGATAIMSLQTHYMMSSLGTTDPGAQISLSFTSVLGAFRRSSEDEMYKSSGFTGVDSPYFPSLSFSSMPAEVVKRHGDAGCLYKPIYMAKLGGSAHTIGAILNFDKNIYAFFDSNNGYVAFQQPESLQDFVQAVQDEYDAAYSAYFVDTKS